MITYAFERERRIILVRFALALTRESFAQLDDMSRRFAVLEGPADSIIDFSDAPVSGVLDLKLAHERTEQPLVMPGTRRAFVSPDDQLFGLLRLYAARQIVEPMVVRTLGAAFEYFGVGPETFQPIDLESVSGSKDQPTLR